MHDLEIAQLQRRYTGLRVMDPGRVSRLAAAIAEEGQRSPVLVVGDVLIDGYHRVQALEELGRDLVSGVSVELSEADALVLAWRFETGRRKTAIEEGWLLAELLETHGRTQATLYPRTPRPAASRTLLAVRSVPADP